MPAASGDASPRHPGRCNLGVGAPCFGDATPWFPGGGGHLLAGGQVSKESPFSHQGRSLQALRVGFRALTRTPVATRMAAGALVFALATSVTTCRLGDLVNPSTVGLLGITPLALLDSA